jgi:hypothetical protein
VSGPDGYHLYFARPLVCFNTLHLNHALAQVPSGATAVYLHVTDLVTLIDHTATTTLFEFVEDFKRSGRGVAEVLGLERLRPRSNDLRCMRTSPPILAHERDKALQAMALMGLTRVTADPIDVVRYLDHLSLSTGVLAFDPADPPVSVYVARALARLVETARGVPSVFHRAYRAVDTDGGRHDLHWFSIANPRAGDCHPVHALDLFGLTAVVETPGVGPGTRLREFNLM